MRIELLPMSETKHIMKKGIAGWLLILFIGYFASVTFFPHTHTVNGERITHSHPFSQAPDTGKHTHTTAEFQLIAHLSIFVMLAAAFGCFLRLLVCSCKQSEQPFIDPGIDRTPPVLCLRGPPIC